MIGGALPRVGRVGDLTLAGLPLQLVITEEGPAYRCYEPERFGDKFAVGPLKYADFEPYESPEVVARFDGGYGLRRYSDLDDPQQAHAYILEADGVDCAAGTAILAPRQTTIALPGSPGQVVWLGEFGGQVAVLTATGLYTLDGALQPQLRATLPAAPLAAAVFADPTTGQQRLLIGYGGAWPAQWWAPTFSGGTTITDDASPGNPLYAYAFTADRAAAYLGGGPSGVAHKVYASTSGQTFAASSATACGRPDVPIAALAPGGGVAVVFVGKRSELGMVTLGGIYQVLVPFDTAYYTNGAVLRWWQGRGGDEQRGPLMLAFSRERALWLYQPSTTDGGRAQNVSPWAQPLLRPPNIRGVVTAATGTARWLYYAVRNARGVSYVLRLDARSGVSLPYLSLGATTCQALLVTALASDGQPRLLCGVNGQVIAAILPLDSDYALDDPACRYAASGTLDLPAMDLGFPEEPKVPFSVRVIANNVAPPTTTVQVQASLDGGAYQTLGQLPAASPVTDIPFPSGQGGAYTVQLRLVLGSTDPTQTPEVRGVVLRQSLNPRLYRLWEVLVRVPGGATPLPSDDTLEPHAVLQLLWDLRRSGRPTVLVDRWGDAYLVRLLRVEEQAAFQEAARPPETRVRLVLLETLTGAGPLMVQWPLSYAGVAGFFPFALPWTAPWQAATDSPQTASAQLINPRADVTYPVFTLRGPARALRLVNQASGQQWWAVLDVPAGGTATADFRPAVQRVTAGDGRDLTGGVQAGSTWWGLYAGAQTVAATVWGGGPGTQLQASWGG